MSLHDSFGRTFKTLRISVTDRCDLRCVYCMPADGMAWLPKQDLLSFKELERLTGIFVRAGISRLRLTGGEPLLRQDLASLVSKLAKIPGVEDLSLTTNGTRLEGQAAALKQAGLQRVTVSLDSLDAARFKAITRTGDLQMVWQGLLAADRAGLGPIKINCVVLPENEADLLPLAALTLERSWEVRFIEVMPVSAALGHSIKPGLSLTALKQRLSERWGGLEAVATDPHAPARRWRLPHSLGKLGFIASVSESFCQSCDRLRLSATGRLQLCMAHPDGLDLRPLLRGGATDDQITQAIAAAVWRKPAGHNFFQTPVPAGLAMSQIGG